LASRFIRGGGGARKKENGGLVPKVKRGEVSTASTKTEPTARKRKCSMFATVGFQNTTAGEKGGQKTGRKGEGRAKKKTREGAMGDAEDRKGGTTTRCGGPKETWPILRMRKPHKSGHRDKGGGNVGEENEYKTNRLWNKKTPRVGNR